jgi:glycosyltransferase involved in cell wall biosynthesis
VHVGLNLVYLVPGQTGGMEVYAQELIPALVAAAPEHRFTAFIGRDVDREALPWLQAVGTVAVPARASNRIEWVRGEQQLLPPLARRAGVQLLHSFASTAPAWGPYKRVVTIHDLIYRTVPEAHPGLRSLGMRVLVPLAARRSNRVIADSQTTADDVHRLLGVPRASIDTVPLGIGAPPRVTPAPPAATRARLGAGDRPVLLTVSAKLAHKNLMRLLGALARIVPAERPLLVLPGYPTPYEAQLRERATRLGLDGDVRFEGWVSAQELEDLWAAASAFVFCSLAEGFGLPILEAMSRGVPVACSDRGAVAEVAGDAALTFDPESETAIAGAIGRLLSDGELARRLAGAGRERAARFSWAATAAGTLASYERALS